MFLVLLLTLSEPDPGMARQSRPELTPGDPLPRYIPATATWFYWSLQTLPRYRALQGLFSLS